MSKLSSGQRTGKLILAGINAVINESDKRAREYAKFRLYKKMGIMDRMGDFKELTLKFSDPNPGEDWRYQAAKEFFRVDGPPPKIFFSDLFWHGDVSCQLDFWEHKRDAFERFTGQKFHKKRGDF